MLTVKKRHQVVTYFISFFSFGLLISTLGIALPYLAEHAKVSLGDAALLFTMNSIGFLFGSLISGALYDVMKGKYLLAFAWFVVAISSFLLPILTLFFYMSLVNIFYGFANATIVVGCNTLITRIDDEKTNSLLSTMHVINGIGAFLTPIIFTLFIQRTGDVVLSYHIYAIFFLLLGVFVLFTPNHENNQKKRDVSEEVATNTQSNVILILLLSSIAFVYVGTEISFTGWIYTFMRVQFPSFGGNAGYVTAAFWLFMTLGRVLFTKLADYFKVRVLMLFTIGGAALGLSIISFFPNMFYMVWIGTAVAGLFMGSVFPFLISFTDQTIGISGKMSGVLFAGTSFGGMLMPYINGQIFETFRPPTAMMSMLSTIVITFFIFLILYNIVPQSDKEVKQIAHKTVYEPPLIT